MTPCRFPVPLYPNRVPKYGDWSGSLKAFSADGTPFPLEVRRIV